MARRGLGIGVFAVLLAIASVGQAGVAPGAGLATNGFIGRCQELAGATSFSFD
jgi:hypothetical protein